MKREGRVHGSCVKLRRHQAEGVKAPTKQTNHSRITGRCPQNRTRCQMCPQVHPTQKAQGKTKGEHKSEDSDATGDFKPEEWRICYATPSCPFSTSGNTESSSFDGDFEYYSDYEEPSSEDESSRAEETRENAQRQTDMLLPIESFLRSVRRVRRLPPVREVPTEEGSGDESGADSDSSWSGVDISEADRSVADLDDWYVVG